MVADEEEICTYNISVRVCLWFCRLDVGLQVGCIGAVLMRLYFGFKSVEELHTSTPLRVDSADTSQLTKEKNLHRQFQCIQITQPGCITVTPLYQQRRLCTNSYFVEIF
jgi:hypothetical protein